MSNKQGSALIWAVALMLVLMIFLANGVAMSFRGLNRTIKAKNYQQAELSARSMAQVAAEYTLQKCTTEVNYCLDFIDTTFTTVTIPPEMGEVNAISIEKTNSEDFIYEFIATAQVTYKQESVSVQVSYRITNTSGDKDNPLIQMQILGYE